MIDPRLPRCIKPPTISGEGRAGTILKCDIGEWERADQFRIQWLRHGKPARCADAYFINDQDIGRPITATVIATNAAGSIASPVSNVITGQQALPPERQDRVYVPEPRSQIPPQQVQASGFKPKPEIIYTRDRNE